MTTKPPTTTHNPSPATAPLPNPPAPTCPYHPTTPLPCPHITPSFPPFHELIHTNPTLPPLPVPFGTYTLPHPTLAPSHPQRRTPAPLPDQDDRLGAVLQQIHPYEFETLASRELLHTDIFGAVQEEDGDNEKEKLAIMKQTSWSALRGVEAWEAGETSSDYEGSEPEARKVGVWLRGRMEEEGIEFLRGKERERRREEEVRRLVEEFAELEVRMEKEEKELGEKEGKGKGGGGRKKKVGGKKRKGKR